MNKNCDISNIVPCRRFGRTDISIPILSLGGMRFQQSWKELDAKEIAIPHQKNLEEIVLEATKNGLNHIETARHYGSSELQLGWAMKNIINEKRIIQTKIPPKDSSIEFEKELEISFKKLKCKKLDLLSIHGINLPEHLDQTLKPGGCLDVVRKWQKLGLIGHVGFSTHANKNLIVQTIETNQFDYVNLHWYFIRQDNEPALEAARKLDIGVFIISPTDKGGHLHTPSQKLLELCSPLHPIIFNDLFCLRDKRIHTISVGASKVSDLELHLSAIRNLRNYDHLISPIETRLQQAAEKALGRKWLETWREGLPLWSETPGYINLPVLIWLHNLVEAWDMEGYAKERYGLLGRGGHWFPGLNADSLDSEISEDQLKTVLVKSPWKNEIPSLLRKLRSRIGGVRKDRLWGI